MANKDNDRVRSLRKVDKKLDTLSQLSDRMYTQTYSTRTDNSKSLDTIKNTIDDNLDTLISRINGQEISDISNLYLRIKSKSNRSTKSTQDEINNSIESLFDQNKQLLDTINMDNVRKSIQAEDYQYDLICKYMTKLEDALDIKKDNVLSSDNFTKEFVNVLSGKNTVTYIDQFNNRATQIKKKYHIQELFDDMYYKTSKYGEYFLYQVPYSRAFDYLLNRKKMFGTSMRYEQVTVLESSNMSKSDQKLFESLSKEFKEDLAGSNFKVQLEFNPTGVIEEPIISFKESMSIRDIQSKKSLCESYTKGFDKNDEVLSELSFEDVSTDGLVTPGMNGNKVESVGEVNGCVLYEIPRSDIIPLYMDTTPLGYLYIRVRNDYVDSIPLNGTYNSAINSNKILSDEVDRQNDVLISYIAGMMSDQIDAKFIKANLDLKEQIYAVLRYNDYFCTTQGTNTITVSFLPVEDVHHFYFRLDPKTHRGISDLAKAAIPAMIYCLLYLNTTLATISRGQDKRVYYVKQNVEQNVARTLLNVITQLKKGNMGMRQLESMNTIFNIVGKYNDHVIPVGQSGDYPIQMEVMQGQQIDTPTELMERMEDAAVSSTDVPLEFIQSVNNVDYAARFTMSNSKFLRKVLKRQGICQTHFTEIFRRCYNYEYRENDTTMQILLPAPAYLAMTNAQQLIDNMKNYANSICEVVCADEEDNVKQEFLNIYMRNCLGTYVDFSQIDQFIQIAKMNIKVKEEAAMDDVNVEDSSDDYSY